MPLECDNIFEDLDIPIENDYADVTEVCVDQIRTLLQRDDWNKEVSILIMAEVLKICARVNEIEEVLEIYEDVINACCYTYYDLLADFMI